GGTLVLRAYRRSVIEPLRSNHARLLESEAFSRTILDNAPIGLCLLHRTDGNVLLDNRCSSTHRPLLGATVVALLLALGWHAGAARVSAFGHRAAAQQPRAAAGKRSLQPH
ncbi:hypothetical protein C7E12_18825, partial [Stenotrophomonas maltophilia]